jgi:hypothetical protein
MPRNSQEGAVAIVLITMSKRDSCLGGIHYLALWIKDVLVFDI